MLLKLFPVTHSGYIKAEDFQYNPLMDGVVTAISFLNQGTNTTVTISYGMVKVVLVPTAEHKIDMPVFGYDITQYDGSFAETGAGPIKKCVISIQKYVKGTMIDVEEKLSI